MSQASVGFKGTVNEVEWAKFAGLMGHRASTLTTAAGKVSQVAGQRAVSISAGPIFGDGVTTTLSVPEQKALPAITNGQWFLLVLNRVWATKATSFEWRNGPTTATASSGLAPAAYPATTATAAGSNSDVPVAWVWGNSAATAVTIVPLLTVSPGLVPRRGTGADRDLVYGTPTTLAAQAALQGQHWFNVERGWEEIYFGQFDATSNPFGAKLGAGWYPIKGRLPFAKYWKTGDFQWLTTPQTVLWDTLKSGTADGFEVSGGVFTIRQAGKWRISGSVGMAISASGQWAIAQLLVDGNPFETAGVAQANNSPVSAEFDFEAPLTAGQTVALRIKASRQFGGTPTIEGGQATKLVLEYIGPA